MKLTKYFVLACSALILASCSNDDDFNTAADVTVQMKDAVLKAKENADLFYVPVEVVGKANGPVRVTVEVTAAQEAPAVEDTHYFVTSKTVNIPAGETSVNIEFAPVNDGDINDDRNFTVTIVSAEGAAIGTLASTEVVIRDDDSVFYEALQGKWTFNDYNTFDNAEESFTVTISGVDEGDEEYDHVLYLSGLAGRSNLVIKGEYNYDKVNKLITIDFELPQVSGQLNFTGLGMCDVTVYPFDGQYYYKSGMLTATISTDDIKTINLECSPAPGLLLGVVSNGTFKGAFDGFMDMSMTR